MRKRSFAAALLFGALVTAPYGLVADDDEASSIAERVDAVFADLDTTRSPGCALGVMRHGELEVARGYGMANLEHGVPIDERTVFRIGSVSKQIAAYTILLLEREGVLDRDDDVRRFVPELPVYERPVTLRHLVHHTSGLRDYLTLMYLRGMRDEDYYTDAEVVDLLARQRELNFAPGDRWVYSNSGYFLLSVIVERATGKRLAAVAEERIFGPLGMRDTHFHDDPTRVVPRRAAGYAPREGGGYTISQTTLPMVGDGGVFTTVRDWLLWDRLFDRDDETRRALRESQLEVGVLENGEATDYAAGLVVGELRGLRSVRHGGAFVGYRAAMMRFPDHGLSFVVMCNLATAGAGTRLERVAGVYLEDAMEPVPPTAVGVPEDEEEPAPAPPSPPDLGAVAGTFYSPELDTRYTVAVEDGALRLRHADPHRELRAEPFVFAADDRFVAPGGTAVRLIRDAERVTGFRLDAGRVKNLLFERVAP